ncbi:MAG: hypothetical protein RH949_02025 [Coleofasciculus sp. A1-SPW-01]
MTDYLFDCNLYDGAIAFLPFGDFAIHLILKPIHYYSIKSDRTP